MKDTIFEMIKEVSPDEKKVPVILVHVSSKVFYWRFLSQSLFLAHVFTLKMYLLHSAMQYQDIFNSCIYIYIYVYLVHIYLFLYRFGH